MYETLQFPVATATACQVAGQSKTIRNHGVRTNPASHRRRNQGATDMTNAADSLIDRITVEGVGLYPSGQQMSIDIIFLPGIANNQKRNWRYSFCQAPPKEKAGHVWFESVTAPNAFHRFMQRILFGIVWKRLP